MALLDGLLHCYTPSLGPTGYQLIDRGPRRIHGVAGAGITSSSWRGNTNRWCLRGTNAANEQYNSCGTFPTGDRTVMAWWRAQAALGAFQQRMAFFGGINSPGQSFQLCLFNNLALSGATISQTGDAIVTGLANDGRWHCVIGTNTGSSWAIYVDGSLAGSKTMTTTQNTTAPIIMGGAGLQWEGDLGESAWWNRLLRPAEIMELYRGGDGAIGRMLTGQAFPKRRLSQVTAGTITNTLTVSNATLNLSGQSSSLILSRKLIVSDGSLNLAGQTTALTVAKTLVGDNAEVNLAGQSVSLGLSRSLTASHGDLSFSGQAVVITVARLLAVNNATVNLSGQVATLSAGKALTVNNGEFQFTGQSVNLTSQRSLTVSNTNIEVQGQQVILRLTKSLVVLPAEVQTSGQTTQLTVARKLTVQNGEVGLASQGAMVRRRYDLGIGEGQASFSGEGVGLLSSRKILATEGRVQFSGQSVQIYPTFQNPVQIFGGNLRFIDKTTGSLRFIQEITR